MGGEREEEVSVGARQSSCCTGQTVGLMYMFRSRRNTRKYQPQAATAASSVHLAEQQNKYIRFFFLLVRCSFRSSSSLLATDTTTTTYTLLYIASSFPLVFPLRSLLALLRPYAYIHIYAVKQKQNRRRASLSLFICGRKEGTQLGNKHKLGAYKLPGLKVDAFVLTLRKRRVWGPDRKEERKEKDPASSNEVFIKNNQ